jgi:hypothetical protein
MYIRHLEQTDTVTHSRLLRRDGKFNVININCPRGPMLHSAYHSLLDMPWYIIGVTVLLAYTMSHVAFGVLYYLCGGVKGTVSGFLWIF